MRCPPLSPFALYRRQLFPSHLSSLHHPSQQWRSPSGSPINHQVSISPPPKPLSTQNLTRKLTPASQTLQNPILLLLATYIIVGSLLILTPPSSLFRLSATGILIPWTYHIFKNGNPDLAPSEMSHYGLVTLVQLLLYGNYFLFINPQSPPPRTSLRSFGQHVKWAYALLTNPRGVGESWGVRNLPSFTRGRPGYIPSKKALILRRCGVVLLCWGVNTSWTYFMGNHYCKSAIRAFLILIPGSQ